MKIGVFGLGYVGCVTAACLAKADNEVVGVDISADKVDMVNSAVSPVVEPGLSELLAQVVPDRLHATHSAEEAVGHSSVALLCVGTPSLANGQLDYGALRRVCEDVGRALRVHSKPYTVVVRSTVLPGSTEQLVIPAIRSGFGGTPDSLRVAVNPEFMREGSSLQDFASPPFTLVGCDEADTADLIRSLYQRVDARFVHASVRVAEMVKYVSNVFHALKVCFANEVGDVCTAFGADPQEVMRIFLLDHKLSVSEAYLRPGFAFGGSCLPKDIRALLHAARSADVATPLLSEILPSNEAQMRRAVDAVLATRKRRVGVVGLSFKAGTDDLRESPLVLLVETLIGKGCDVRILDGNVSIARLAGANRRYIEEEIPHVSSLLCPTVKELIEHAEVLVIGNASDEAAQAVAAALPNQVVIDLTRRSGVH